MRTMQGLSRQAKIFSAMKEFKTHEQMHTTETKKLDPTSDKGKSCAPSHRHFAPANSKAKKVQENPRSELQQRTNVRAHSSAIVGAGGCTPPPGGLRGESDPAGVALPGAHTAAAPCCRHCNRPALADSSRLSGLSGTSSLLGWPTTTVRDLAHSCLFILAASHAESLWCRGHIRRSAMDHI